jgi:penicillin-binding protein 2
MNRIVASRIAILLVFVALIGRLYQLQLVDTEASRFRSATEQLTTRYLPVRPLRGEIYAADGKTLLAESVPIYTVALRPATLDQAAPIGSPERAMVFAQLSHMIGITTTLTISPSLVLEQQPGLREALNNDIGATLLAQAKPQSRLQPLELTLPPELGAAAGELIRRHSAYVSLQHRRAAGSEIDPTVRRDLDAALAGIGGALQISNTLVISPGSRLREDAQLQADLRQLLGDQIARTIGDPVQLNWLTLDVPPKQGLAAFRLSQIFSQTLSVQNPLADQVDNSNIPGYQTLTLKRGINRDVAMVLRENSPSLPGVVVEEDYRRVYPLSNEIQSLSHLLGYIGLVDSCDLVAENPARSWTSALVESIGNVPQCGFIAKPIDPLILEQPRYLRDDRIGRIGIEGSYEEELRGELGFDAVMIDIRGRPVRAPQSIQPVRNGYNLVMTIDVPFQRQVEQILRNWITEGENRRLAQNGPNQFKRDEYAPIRAGAAVVMEVKTGRILAMASWPSYDNNIWDASRSAELVAFLNPADPDKQKELAEMAPLTNRAIAGLYPVGSTLKQFDALIAMQKGIIGPTTQIRDPGKIIIEDQFVAGQFYEYPNSTPRDNEWIDVSEALKVSSNVFFMAIAGGNKDRVVNLTDEEKTIEKGLQVQRLAEGLGWFGFGKSTGIDLAGESRGLVPTPAWKLQQKREQWTTGDTYNMSIGQGNMLATPLQLVRAGAAVANNGYLYKPHLVQAIVDSSGNVVREITPTLESRLPIGDPAFYQVVREGMRRSITEGVNVAARDECSGLQIAGKTGTAEFGRAILLDNGRNNRVEYQTHSWFVGYAPYDDPQIQVVVLSEGTGSLGDGSATIGVPSVTQIMQAYFKVTPPDPLPPNCLSNLPSLPPRIELDQTLPSTLGTSAP